MWLFSEEDKSWFSTDRSLKSLDSGLTEARSSLDMSGRGPIVDMGGGGNILVVVVVGKRLGSTS